VQYIIRIKDKDERIRFAADIKKILHTANIKTQDYIPSSQDSIVKCDIGIKATGLKKKTLAQVLSQVERRGYIILNAKGSDESSLKHSTALQQHNITGEVNNGNIT
jgi:hypothetical protein|tara:strand:+ start:1058 stop:1375 length:318 start_codon:yes stop_codon:yes gene_type:complete